MPQLAKEITQLEKIKLQPQCLLNQEIIIDN